MKNCKSFWKAQTAIRLKEVIQPPTSHPLADKTLLHFWNKNFLKEIYRNIQTFAFNVLQECSFWAPRNGAVQIFFLTPNRNMFTVYWFVKSERFLAVLWEHIILMSSKLSFLEWVRFFEQNCIVKCVIFIAKFCWLWDFLLENLKLKKNSDDIHWNVWINIKTLYARNNISKKRIPNMRFFIFWSKFCFLGDYYRAFFVVG